MIIIKILLLLNFVFISSCTVSNKSRLPAAYSGMTPIDVIKSHYNDPQIKDFSFLAATSKESCNTTKLKDIFWKRAHSACVALGHQKSVGYRVGTIKEGVPWLIHMKTNSGKLESFHSGSCPQMGRSPSASQMISTPQGISITRENKYVTYPKKFSELDCH